MKKKRKLNTNLLIFILILTLYTTSLIFFTSSILSLTGIETYLRISILILLYLFLAMYFVWGFISVAARNKKTFAVISTIIMLFVPIFGISSFYINKTFNTINNINKDKITYTTALVTLKNTSIKNNNSSIIGMISDESDIEGYVLGNKLLDKKHLNKVDIKKYDDYILMLTDLLNGDIDGVLISNNYLIMFGDDEELTNLKDNTEVLYTYSETRDKVDTSSSNKTLTEPFSILLIGVDSENPKMNANQAFNGDTLMIITFNPKTLNATMFSIPRDTYVPIACRKNAKDKINTSAYYGSECVINTVENLVDIDLDYYVKINFKGVVALVDALGGIDVQVPYSFCEQNSNREFGNSTIYVEKGLQHLNGEEALALARNRHSWPAYCSSKWNTGLRNDFIRGQNQQLVVGGIAKSIRTINSPKEFYNILNAISQNIDTNISTNKLLSFYEVAKDIILKSLNNETDFINIEKTFLTGYDLTINSRYTFQYYKESLNAIVKAMKYNLELEEPDMIKTFDFSIKNTYEKQIIGKTYISNEPRLTTMPYLIGNTKTYVDTWALQNNITVTYNYIAIGDPLYNETLLNNTVVSQSIKATTLLDGITNITIGIIKK